VLPPLSCLPRARRGSFKETVATEGLPVPVNAAAAEAKEAGLNGELPPLMLIDDFRTGTTNSFAEAAIEVDELDEDRPIAVVTVVEAGATGEPLADGGRAGATDGVMIENV
jgi:hypothetical protein